MGPIPTPCTTVRWPIGKATDCNPVWVTPYSQFDSDSHLYAFMVKRISPDSTKVVFQVRILVEALRPRSLMDRHQPTKLFHVGSSPAAGTNEDGRAWKRCPPPGEPRR